ncbi:hypothetical protein SAMN04489832_3552 [Micromonospora cremea]|uniref:Uncharacterized protein n=1 Tax=Micromonospora cremea TaxID=709881 RepID=A0A1N5Z275_9ACTN|nr:hypothetical protein SAMN04489832_3552 [Micromonospora cremea]
MVAVDSGPGWSKLLAQLADVGRLLANGQPYGETGWCRWRPVCAALVMVLSSLRVAVTLPP